MAEDSDGAGDGGRALGGFAHVQRMRQNAALRALGQSLGLGQARFIDIGGENGGARLRQTQRHGPGEAGSGARQKASLSRQINRNHLISPFCLV
jgi:hypothetical protein